MKMYCIVFLLLCHSYWGQSLATCHLYKLVLSHHSVTVLFIGDAVGGEASVIFFLLYCARVQSRCVVSENDVG